MTNEHSSDPERPADLAAGWRGGGPALQEVQRQEIDADTAFLSPRGYGVCSNVTVFRTSAGLVMVDTGSPRAARPLFAAVRAWDQSPLRYAVYTHGHGDHVHGVVPFDEEAEAPGGERPVVVASELLPGRFDRYTRTAGYNRIINLRQFAGMLPAGVALPAGPALALSRFRYPDRTFADQLTLDLGGEPFELYHGRGETDDHTWVWAPQRRIVCPGDFFISVFPNAGNPQKVQRYAREWALALRAMAAKRPAVLLPGHGTAIVGEAEVERALLDTAEALEFIDDETVRLMNEGATLDQVIHSVKVPERYLAKPYLRVTYDDPEFLVRNVWRLYGGWYDGNPAQLKPAPEAELAAEIASLSGGAARLAARARELAEQGNLRLAGHLAQLAVQAAPDDAAVHEARAEVFERRVAAESTLMAKGIFGEAARDSRERARRSGG